MYVIPFTEDPSIWDAVLFIHQGESSHGIHLRILFRARNLKLNIPTQGYYTDSILRFRVDDSTGTTNRPALS